MILSDGDLGAKAPCASARRLDVTPEEYHRDPCPEPSLSSSLAHVLESRTPAHAWQAHPKLGGGERTSTDEQDRGALIHRLLLGKGAEIVVVREDNYRKKTAQRERAAAYAAGAVPVLERKFDEAREVADKIRAKLAAEGVEFTGESEVAIAWQEPTKRGPIWCRSMLDHVLETGLIVDVKTARSAKPEAVARSILDYGYDIQSAAYTRALERLWPELAGRVRFELCVVETEPPYAVSVGPLDGVLRAYGEHRWARAVETWARCLREGEWRAYGRVRFPAPGWLASKMGEML